MYLVPKKHTYSIEQLSDNNINDLVSLYEASFGKTTTKELIQNKFNTSFTNYKNIGFIAYSETREPAAFYGVFPCYAMIDGAKFLVAQSGHTMTHPKHRRAKLFLKLAKETFDYCKKEGFKAVFGFPNIYSYASFVKKLEWEHFDDYHSFNKRVQCFPWIRAKKTFPFLKGIHKAIQTKQINRLKDIKGFENSIDNKHPQVLHDSEFHNYKKFQNSFLKDINGVKCWFKFDDIFLLVGDLSFNGDFKAAHKEIEKLSKKLGIPHVKYQISSETKLFEECKNNDFTVGNTYPIAGINLEESFPLNKMKFTLADFDTF